MVEVIGKHFVLTSAETRTGGLSTVRKAMDTRDASTVAVKFIVGQSAEVMRKVFERETQTLRALSHTNIVGFRDAGLDETGTYYIVLDWVDSSLLEVLKTVGPWTGWQALYTDLAEPLLDALSHAHLNSVEHRDIKPGNILIANDGRPLLADFGISKFASPEPQSDLTVQGWRSGIYAPPEVETPLKFVRDVYGMGVLLIRCMAEDAIRDLGELQRALEAAPVSPDVRDVLADCIDPDPHERPENASELAARLARIESHALRRRERPKNPIWLRLTKAAEEHVVGEAGNRNRAGSAVLSDLSREVFAQAAVDRKTGMPLSDRLVLFGSERKYSIAVEGNKFVVTAARSLELEQLEGGRRHAVLLPPVFDWSVHQPSDSAANQAAVAALLGVVDEFHQAEVVGDTTASSTDAEVFETWLSILDAREDLARGELEPLPYRHASIEGRRCEFTLKAVCELDLIGTDWEAYDPQSGRSFGRGEVIEQDTDTITLLSRVDFRPLPKTASLRPYNGPSAVALGRQRTALNSVRDRVNPNSALREILVDPSSSEAPISPEIDEWALNLDERKQDAVRAALGTTQVLLVQGPPGTGKTSFITETVLQYLRLNPGSRILIASQTHVAVDNAVERLHAAGVEGIVRLAGIDDSAVQAGAKDFVLPKRLRHWANDVRKHAEAKIARDASEANISTNHLRAALLLEQVASVAQNTEMLRERIDELAAIETSSRSELATAVEGEDPREQMQSRLESLADRQGELVQQVQRELGGDLTIHTDIDSAQARTAIDLLVGEEPDLQKLMRLVEIQANWLDRIASEESLTPLFLAGRSVIAGTCTGFLRLQAVADLEFDLCIVDEASKATLTEALVPMSRSKAWILVGDTRQLPPTDEDLLRSPTILEEHGISAAQVSETLFQRMVDMLPDHSQLMLTEQYRMIRPIGDLVSTCFYEGKLRSPRVDGLVGYNEVAGSPVTWLDTSGLGDRRREDAAGTSRANRAEANILAKHLETIDKSVEFSLIKPPAPGRLEVLVIAPYKGQVEQLRRRILPLTLKHLEVSVLSVDAVQGREADLVLMSVTRSNPEGELGFLGADYWRRINVALSRARFGLTIVGDAEFIRGTQGALRNVIEYMEQHPGDCVIRPADS